MYIFHFCCIEYINKVWTFMNLFTNTYKYQISSSKWPPSSKSFLLRYLRLSENLLWLLVSYRKRFVAIRPMTRNQAAYWAMCRPYSFYPSADDPFLELFSQKRKTCIGPMWCCTILLKNISVNIFLPFTANFLKKFLFTVIGDLDTAFYFTIQISALQ